MARVSVRFGWGRGSFACLVITLINLGLAFVLWRANEHGLALLLTSFASVTMFFGLIHPHRVLELDDDDSPDREVGDILDD